MCRRARDEGRGLAAGGWPSRGGWRENDPRVEGHRSRKASFRSLDGASSLLREVGLRTCGLQHAASSGSQQHRGVLAAGASKRAIHFSRRFPFALGAHEPKASASHPLGQLVIDLSRPCFSEPHAKDHPPFKVFDLAAAIKLSSGFPFPSPRLPTDLLAQSSGAGLLTSLRCRLQPCWLKTPLIRARSAKEVLVAKFALKGGPPGPSKKRGTPSKIIGLIG